ncbi:hypothetical protein FTUN_1103 [Frigoriglobus tundricola]|uniref:Uncharacterized protein n=1 Tax=Frigoriglobus tundricola TaxID=2774151 RepID=A0A6M5YJX9_9BACT|nr:hypothetical protein FTUN_1103 [Frigoriglobus tundricola]
MPPLLLLATMARSYGVWQKLITVYFLFAANIDCLLATGRLTLPGPDAFGRKPRRRVRGTYAHRVIRKRNVRPPQ